MAIEDATEYVTETFSTSVSRAPWSGSASDFYIPGSILEMRPEPGHAAQ